MTFKSLGIITKETFLILLSITFSAALGLKMGFNGIC